MKIIADTHVHCYPSYDIAVFFRYAFENLEAIAPGATKVICLTESADCDFFSRLKRNGAGMPGFDLQPVQEPGVLRVTNEEGNDLLVIAGRQIVTSERLELLALGAASKVPDGLNVQEAIQHVCELHAIPVLSWAPGKWLFGRGKIVQALLDDTPDRLVLGDTSLRPTVWGEPVGFRRGAKKGLRIIAGSDPLPPLGEEKYVGSYATCFEADFDTNRPLASLKSALAESKTELSRVGRRGSIVDVFSRLRRHKNEKCHG